ncbi:hypothetical protein SAMD00023353_7200070 [Rosellinia necatrix]|uniref:Uncharacterized protein n=1 Tax=Rosellinia necatrix TaxID=77044 RepID=A0A1S8AAI6_ROSNE|nr:hypothetical protein SAMD00023353_7200070 [Rosellinia necatrix]
MRSSCQDSNSAQFSLIPTVFGLRSSVWDRIMSIARLSARRWESQTMTEIKHVNEFKRVQ